MSKIWMNHMAHGCQKARNRWSLVWNWEFIKSSCIMSKTEGKWVEYRRTQKGKLEWAHGGLWLTDWF